jgi:uncharacterized protein YegL
MEKYLIGAIAFWLLTIEVRMWMHRRGINVLGETIIELAESLEYEPADDPEEIH